MRVAKVSLIGLATASGMLALTASVQAQGVKEEWVVRYDGPAHDIDRLRGMVLDNSGNVYVTGGSVGESFKFTTIKYDTEGNQLWLVHQGRWESKAIAVDDGGNVYVSGTGFVTYKYNTDGKPIWRVKPKLPFGNSAALAIDDHGNVYVTGRGMRDDDKGNYDYLTIKYDAAGQEQWRAFYDGPKEKSYDNPRAIVVNDQGGVYVTGESEGEGEGCSRFGRIDFATVKYDAAGTELWVSRYDACARYADLVRTMALDHSGNVYVVGRGGDQKRTTIKYDSEGRVVWVDASREGGAIDVAIDGSDNVYVTGNGDAGSTTIKFDPSGREIWATELEEDFWPRVMALDGLGNVYISGRILGVSREYYDFDFGTFKYDRKGNYLWMTRYNGPGNQRSHEEVVAIAIDANNNVFVAGQSTARDSNGRDIDYATVKYSQASGGCTGREKLKANCKVIRSFNLVKAVAVKGTQGDTVEFCLDDDDCKEKKLNQRGKVKAKWKGHMPGEHTVTAEWTCEASKKRNVDCPNP